MAGGKCCEVKWYKWVVMGNKGDSILDRVTKEGFLAMVKSKQTPELLKTE